MSRRLLATALLLSPLGCGVQEIELAPDVGEVIVQGDVPRAAIEQLARALPGKPEPRLAISEPSDGIAIPGNLAPLGFRFKSDKKPMMPMMMMEPMPKPAGGGEPQAFELSLHVGARELRVYTREDRAAVPDDRWRWLLDGATGATLEAQLQALQADGRVITGAPISIALLAPITAGRFGYWSESQGRALAFQLEQASAEEFEAAFPGLDPWESWHAEARLIASAQDGLLRVSRAAQELSPTWVADWQVEQPDWWWDASALVFVTAAAGASPAGMKPPAMLPPEAAPPPSGARSALMRARWLDAQTLSSPELVLESDKADELLRSPVSCPHARSIVFERAKEKDAVGKLWIVSSEGGEPAELGTGPGWKSEGGGPTCLVGGAEGELWVAFSQARAPGDDKLAANQVQLWLVAARETADGRLTATHQPFWLPQQRPDESNRRLLWFAE